MSNCAARRYLVAVRFHSLFIGAILIALAAFLWSENNFAKSFQACIGQNSGGQRSDSTEQYGQSIARGVETQTVCTVWMIDRHNGLVSAFAGIAVGFFTFTLWRSTEKLWKAGKEELEVTERAFVFIDGFTPEITTAADLDTDPLHLPEHYRNRKHLYMHRFALLPRWKNGGSTPTQNMKIQVGWRSFEGTVPPKYVYLGDPVPFFLGPLAVEHSLPIEMPPAQQVIDYAFHYKGGEPMVCIWGRADYEDIFGRPHFLEWCYKLRFDAHDGKRLRVTPIQLGDHNRTDEST